jgi:hypothetical protein
MSMTMKNEMRGSLSKPLEQSIYILQAVTFTTIRAPLPIKRRIMQEEDHLLSRCPRLGDQIPSTLNRLGTKEPRRA